MEASRDFIQLLGPDLSMKILTSLEDPSDLIRFSAVSTSWCRFAMANGLSKRLCLEKYPELSSVGHVIEENYRLLDGVEKCVEQKGQERDHRIYGFLCRGLSTSMTKWCISDAVAASSTGNHPEESIRNTLEPRERVGDRASYWSSQGQIHPALPEKLVFKLISKLCVVTEIHIQPFQATCFQNGSSVYSARAVRFRMGNPKSPVETEDNGKYKFEASYKYDDNAFIWTYISPEFPMAQENCLQKFKLPEPVLCIGGILQVELLGRVQNQETDGLFYIRIAHVQVVGRPLSPGFDIKIVDDSRRSKLEYYPGIKYRRSPSKVRKINRCSSFQRFTATVRKNGEEMFLNSIFTSGVAIYFLLMAFICLFFFIKLFKVPLFSATYLNNNSIVGPSSVS